MKIISGSSSTDLVFVVSTGKIHRFYPANTSKIEISELYKYDLGHKNYYAKFSLKRLFKENF